MKPVYMWYLDLVVKRLCCIDCLNPWATNCPLCEVKSYAMVLSFYKKMMKWRTLQGCSLKHSIKKGMFFCLGQNWNYLNQAGGVFPTSPLLHWMRSWLIELTYKNIAIILHARLLPIEESLDHKTQFGFTPRRRCMNAIFTNKMALKKRRKHGLDS